MLRTVCRWLSISLLTFLIINVGCDSEDDPSAQQDECSGRCVAPSLCREGQCVFILDQATPLDLSSPDMELDEGVDLGPDLSCATEGERRFCPDEFTPPLPLRLRHPLTAL